MTASTSPATNNDRNDNAMDASSSSAFPEFLFMRRPSRPMADKKPLALPAMPNISGFLFGLCSTTTNTAAEPQPFDEDVSERQQQPGSDKKKKKSKKSSKKSKKAKDSKAAKDTDDDDNKPKRNSFLSVMERLLKSKNGKDLIKKHAKAPKVGHSSAVAAAKAQPDKKKSKSSKRSKSETKSRSRTRPKRVSCSERSATAHMDESMFDWREYRCSQTRNSQTAQHQQTIVVEDQQRR
ncbi:expressed unknown protein [Seminavis robusta]|uniref:Uncharacterized protein n=1 Tax=Seminavis robusta TaxID=568900 RepID=A0A9N8EPN5_9STRA|nr:expressed unknown protein [Seminavis robusta]|eukprot:Sro1614_g286100.1 n/a (237) ;mRNA; r:8315-9025